MGKLLFWHKESSAAAAFSSIWRQFLALTCGLITGADHARRLAAVQRGKPLDRHALHVEVDIDALEDEATDAPLLALDGAH